MSTDDWDRLRALQRVTGAVGILHESQKLQLQYWPYVAAPHADNIETHCNLNGKTVVFNLTVKKKKAPKDFQARLEGLYRSVQDMLGEDWLVLVNKNNKEIFNGKRRKEFKDLDSAERDFLQGGKDVSGQGTTKR